MNRRGKRGLLDSLFSFRLVNVLVIVLFVANFLFMYNLQKNYVSSNTFKQREKELDDRLKLIQDREAELEKEAATLKAKKREIVKGGEVSVIPQLVPVEPNVQIPQETGDDIPKDENLFWDLTIPKDEEALKKDRDMKTASNWVLSEIERVQNPTNCESAKFMYCPVYNSCGAGCMLHQLAYCFLAGFANKRTVILQEGWNYLRECPGKAEHWTCMFEPISNCSAPLARLEGAPIWSKEEEKKESQYTQVGLFSRGYGFQNPNFFPWYATDGFHTKTPFYIPEEVKEIVEKYHGDYRVWLVGHIESYMLRLNKEYINKINEMNKNLIEKFKHPVVGIHVRRTDHGREAPFRMLNEYMDKAAQWFDDNNIPQEQRTIYLATDAPEVITEAEENYSKYKWLYYKSGDMKSGNVSPDPYSRSKFDATLALFSDWKFLSSTDFLVGTSSSQVGRMAYELMQVKHADAAKNFVSLDDPWYFP